MSPLQGLMAYALGLPQLPLNMFVQMQHICVVLCVIIISFVKIWVAKSLIAWCFLRQKVVWLKKTRRMEFIDLFRRGLVRPTHRGRPQFVLISLYLSFFHVGIGIEKVAWILTLPYTDNNLIVNLEAKKYEVIYLKILHCSLQFSFWIFLIFHMWVFNWIWC